MQVRRFEADSLYLPRGTSRPAAEQAGDRSELTQTTRTTGSNSKTEYASALTPFLDQLSDIPRVRADVIDAAREKVAQGFFDTRGTAEQLAATTLRHEYFRPRSAD